MAKENKVGGLELHRQICMGDYCCKRARVNGYCSECEVKNANEQSGTATA